MQQDCHILSLSLSLSLFPRLFPVAHGPIRKLKIRARFVFANGWFRMCSRAKGELWHLGLWTKFTRSSKLAAERLIRNVRRPMFVELYDRADGFKDLRGKELNALLCTRGERRATRYHGITSVPGV